MTPNLTYGYPEAVENDDEVDEVPDADEAEEEDEVPDADEVEEEDEVPDEVEDEVPDADGADGVYQDNDVPPHRALSSNGVRALVA